MKKISYKKNAIFIIIFILLFIANDINTKKIEHNNKQKTIFMTGKRKQMTPLLGWFEKNIVKTKEDVITIKSDVISLYQKIKETLMQYKDHNINEENSKEYFQKTYYFLDQMYYAISKKRAYLEYYELCCGQEEVMNEIQKAQQEMSSYYLDNISYNYDIYCILKTVGEIYLKSNINILEVEKKLIQDTMKSYKKIGINLDNAQKERLKKLLLEIEELSLQFSINIQNVDNHIIVKEDDLEGLTDKQKMRLSLLENGSYKIGVDYPTYELIMKYCQNRTTRKRLYHEFSTRAYPTNNEIFTLIRTKKHEIANILGYENFVAYDLEDVMAKNICQVENLLEDIYQATKEKAIEEKKTLQKFAEELFHDNSFIIHPWDTAYINEKYKQKYYHVNSEEIAQYFCTLETIQKLLDIYCTFFDINMHFINYQGEYNEWTYDKDVYVVRCTNKDGSLIGDIILDLFPRPCKYSHACQFTMVSAVLNESETALRTHPIVGIIANFNKPTEDNPSFLYMSQVETFFHEFGHALHSLFGQSKWYSYSGTAVYADFVETPSQLFEFWLLDKKILKQISCHYQTKQHLSDQLIDQLINEQYHNIALQYQSHIAKMNFCLNIFLDPSINSLDLVKQYNEKMISLSIPDIQDTFISAFGHLTSSLYGPKYYAYLWALIYSIAFFNYINKNNGLLNPAHGRALRETVLAQGGTIEPDKLITNYLNTNSIDKVALFKKYINRVL